MFFNTSFFCLLSELLVRWQGFLQIVGRRRARDVLKTKTPKTPKTLKRENKDPPYFGGLRNNDQPVANAVLGVFVFKTPARKPIEWQELRKQTHLWSVKPIYCRKKK